MSVTLVTLVWEDMNYIAIKTKNGKMGSMNNMELDLNSKELNLLRRLLIPSFILSMGLVLIITLVNLAMHFMDVITGIEGLGRPPISRLIIIEAIAASLGMFTFLYLSRSVRKDLSRKIKVVEISPVKKKFSKRENGELILKLILGSNRTVDVDKLIFEIVREGDSVVVERTPKSEFVLNVRKMDQSV